MSSSYGQRPPGCHGNNLLVVVVEVGRSLDISAGGVWNGWLLVTTLKKVSLPKYKPQKYDDILLVSTKLVETRLAVHLGIHLCRLTEDGVDLIITSLYIYITIHFLRTIYIGLTSVSCRNTDILLEHLTIISGEKLVG